MAAKALLKFRWITLRIHFNFRQAFHDQAFAHLDPAELRFSG